MTRIKTTRMKSASLDMLRVILRPAFNRHGARLHGKFVVTLDGRQLCISRQPLLDAARVLINEGIDPTTPIATRHAGAGFDAITSTVGTAAKWTVREDSTGSPTFVRWKAFSRDDVQSPMRFGERPVPEPRAHPQRRSGAGMTLPRPVSRETEAMAPPPASAASATAKKPLLRLPAFRSPEATAAGASGNRGRDFGDERNEIGSTQLSPVKRPPMRAVVRSNREPSIGNAIRSKH